MFYWILLALSILPYGLVPLMSLDGVPTGVENVRATFLFIASAHIAVTMFLYWDKDFRKIRAERPVRYFYAPILAVLIAGVSLGSLPDSSHPIWWIGYAVWQNWHFGRQNFGIYSLVAIDPRSGVRVTRFERYLIHASITLGSIGVAYMVVGTHPLKPYADIAREICGYLTLLVFLLAVGYVLVKRATIGWQRGVFLLFVTAFFFPQYLFDSASIASNTYGLSHGLQYILLVAILAINKDVETSASRAAIRPQMAAALAFLPSSSSVALG
jgi:hypothetical protein